MKLRDGSVLGAGEIDKAYADAKTAFGGAFGKSRAHQRFVKEPRQGEEVVAQIDAIVADWTRVYALTHPDREVWPVVVLDPVQRLVGGGEPEVEALNALARELRVRKNERGWIIIATADTNANAARGNSKPKDGPSQESAAASIRGSYNLIHECDAALVITRGADAAGDESMKSHSTGDVVPRAPLMLSAEIFKNRWGPHLPDPSAVVAFRWHPTRSWFESRQQREAF